MLRIVDKQVDSGWVRLTLKELNVSDVFRLYEPDMEPVPGLWKVLETPVEENGVWGVIVEEVELQ